MSFSDLYLLNQGLLYLRKNGKQKQKNATSRNRERKLCKINIPREVKESTAILKREQHAIQREHSLRIKELNSVTAHESSNAGGYQEKG